MIGYILYRFKMSVRQTILALLISFFWVKFTGFYNYSGGNFILFQLNIFTFILWTAGLTGFKEIYDHMKCKWRLPFITGAWMVFIITIEWIGYNALNIQLASHYTGLFGLELLHLPILGQLYYLLAVPIFILMSDWLEVK
ncbi:hypothetical protein DRQ25_12420 [Candidatus Fermentibacteria bacterium]|nr:MAG: hypothetical protein DRQ25_12420 [Candidatus Fermentibacteria bacterium]